MNQHPLGQNIVLGPGPWESPGFSQPPKGIRRARPPAGWGNTEVKWSLEAQPPPTSEQLLTQKWQGTSPRVGFQSVQSQTCSEGSLPLMVCMFQSRLRLRSSPSSPCCRVSGTSSYKMRLSFDRKTAGGEEEVEGRGWRGKRLFLGPVTCTPKGSAKLLCCPQPTKVGWEEGCILFPNREAFQRHSPPRKTLLETSFQEFCFNFSEIWGSNATENTHVAWHDYILCRPRQCKIKGWDPRFYK